MALANFFVLRMCGCRIFYLNKKWLRWMLLWGYDTSRKNVSVQFICVNSSFGSTRHSETTSLIQNSCSYTRNSDVHAKKHQVTETSISG